MSDYLSFELQVEIIKRLPVKPLLQFRSVSKRWKTLVDNSKFIATHTVGQTQLNHFLYDANKLILSFDMTTQEFTLIDLPNCFAHQSSMEISISKLKGSLVLLEYGTNNEKQDCVIWVMNNGVPNLFSKLCAINAPYASIKILAFIKNGGPMMEKQYEFGEPAAFVFYDLCSKDFNHTAIYAKGGSFFVDSYMETLLLLDHPDSSAFLSLTEDKPVAALKKLEQISNSFMSSRER
ncbi:unnamed protein product [Lactuca virosa]|uniref:F-box domain-containing protein n=1 Tax=Lactuca virosa TaxID=75947 RepID=A0AAU9NB75_9ASTR|nr:unnamed protein product [Lactuca virosa]